MPEPPAALVCCAGTPLLAARKIISLQSKPEKVLSRLVYELYGCKWAFEGGGVGLFLSEFAQDGNPVQIK